MRPKSQDPKSETINFRVTPEMAKFIQLNGGAEFLRRIIEQQIKAKK